MTYVKAREFQTGNIQKKIFLKWEQVLVKTNGDKRNQLKSSQLESYCNNTGEK